MDMVFRLGENAGKERKKILVFVLSVYFIFYILMLFELWVILRYPPKKGGVYDTH